MDMVAIPFRPLEELEAERYRTEMEEVRRFNELKKQEKNRLEKEKRNEERAELPSYMGVRVDLLA